MASAHQYHSHLDLAVLFAKEMIEARRDIGIDKVCQLANKIYDKGIILQRMKESIFITIPKKGNLVQSSNYRLIRLMSHVAKIILRVLMLRLRNKFKNKIDPTQFGFCKGKGTRNAIFNMRMLTERSVEMQKDLYVAYIDYEKSFDTVKHTELFKELSKNGIDGKDLRIIRNLYWEQLTTIRIGKQHSTWISIKRGVRQGCVLSLDLFLIYGQAIINKIISEVGFKENGTPLFNIRYADDTVIIAEDEDSLKQLLIKLKQESEKMGLNSPSPPFTHVGLEFTGHLFLKLKGSSVPQKAYVCIFTCASTRMVHFELTNDMTTDEFLQAFKRMYNRRGLCNTMWSDNQSTFKRANKDLQWIVETSKTKTEKIWKKIDAQKVETDLANRGIAWKFITERSPHR